MDAVALILIMFALIAGLVAGWVLGGRPLAPLRRERDDVAARLSTVEEQRNAALRDLVVEQERARQAASLAQTLQTVQAEREAALRDLAALRSDQQARGEAFEAQVRTLMEAKEQLSAQFAELAQKVLAEAQGQFLKRADERFLQANEKSEAQLKILLQPVETTLKRYEEGLGRVEKERVDSYASLREAVEQVRTGQGQVRDETARLVNALRSSPKARGRWGEQSLRNVLEQAGLSPHADFRSEVSVDTEDGRLRPDVIVSLPGGRELIIDAKCSLNAYLDASDEVDEALRTGHLKNHAASIRLHAQQLGAKDYWARFGKAADYVIMYIPGEHFLSAALEQDEGLWDWAFERRVLLATPTNLVAIARTVAAVWRQEKMAEEAKRIGHLGKELYERLSVASGALKKLGTRLNGAVGDYNAFTASFESRVLVTGRKFRDLNIETADRELEELEPIEALAREPSSPEALRGVDEARMLPDAVE
ncbi:DNA recombination protein RmuC [Sphingobium aquiterrae]|uniref:DNA recombination protein RmuC n=1 Tax=Sphingobium aquiterrae TaxID=2038656 RepID=UPI003018941A